MAKQRKSPQSRSPFIFWFDRSAAVLVLVNLTLVLFDLSYIPWRDFYFQTLPQMSAWIGQHLPGSFSKPLQAPTRITQIYDPIKGISPHRTTTAYLQEVDRLEMLVAEWGVRSPYVEEQLAILRSLSDEMIDENPFQSANKTGSLERIKNRMRDHVGEESSKQAFEKFWSQNYLAHAGWRSEIQFFNQQIRPSIAANYFRSIGEDGNPTDRFWQIDLLFFPFFGLAILVRVWWLRRSYPSLSWKEAFLSRWYDSFLFIPIWRWLRIIPLLVRSGEAELLDTEPIRSELSRGFVSSFADELTQVIVIQVISQVQKTVQDSTLIRRLLQDAMRPYVDTNNTNELGAISHALVQVTTAEVLPQIRPDLEALLRHSVEQTLSHSPLYQGLHQLPGIGTLPTQLVEQLITRLSQVLAEGPGMVYQTMTTQPKDPIGEKLTQQLVQRLVEVFGAELQQQQTLEEIQNLVAELLEEIKFNYVKRSSLEDFSQILEETRQLQRKT